MRLPLIKCHGSGNDFPLLDARGLGWSNATWRAVAIALADRAGPVGGDGLLLLVGDRRGEAMGMRMFNSDGSEAEMCLNGLRCVGRLAMELTARDSVALTVGALHTVVAKAPPLAPGVFTVSEKGAQGDTYLSRWPMHIGREEVIDAVIEQLPSERPFTAITMPNPHLVSFVGRIDEDELVALGTYCESAPDWLPSRANVSFVEEQFAGVDGHMGDGLFVRTFERGVGLTDSCGSAMASSLYAAMLTDRLQPDTEVTIWNKGGFVRGSVEPCGTVTLIGNATWEWTGGVSIDPNTGAVSDVAVEHRHDNEVAAWTALTAGAATASARSLPS